MEKTTAIVIKSCTVVSNKAKGLGKALPGQASTHSKHTVHSSQICFSQDIAENNKMGWEKSVVIFASHSQRVIKTENHFSTDMQNKKNITSKESGIAEKALFQNLHSAKN